MGGRLAKQAPNTSSRSRQESVNNNQNREETNPKQTRSSADDSACRKPALGKHVVDVPADRNVRDGLKLSSAKTTVNIGTWNVRSLLGSCKGVAKIDMGCSWSSRVALEGSRSPGS